MTAGSGILHEEQLPASERMLGVQLWLNLPARDKMTTPAYQSIKRADIEEIMLENGKVRLLAGEYEGRKGFSSSYLPLDYYDIHLNANSSVVINTERDRSIMVFTLLGDAYVGGTLVTEKTAAKLTEGGHVVIKAADQNVQVLFVSSRFLGEPIAWGGPIVMNTREELQKAFDDLDKGTFLQQKIAYKR
jgi:redox-sensitive bicupin YhaK (pirin superfamily)